MGSNQSRKKVGLSGNNGAGTGTRSYLAEFEVPNTNVNVVHTDAVYVNEICQIRVTNNTGAAITFDMWVTSDGTQDDTNLIYSDYSLDSNKTLIDDSIFYLPINGTIEIQASAAGLSVQVWGLKETESTGGSDITEAAQDAVGSILTDTNSIDFTYDDATPQITADVTINPLTDTVITASDEIMFADADDSFNIKKDTVQGILDLATSAASSVVAVSANDTTPGYLEDKIVSADTKLTVSTINDGGDEDVQLQVNDANIDHDALLNFDASEHFTQAAISIPSTQITDFNEASQDAVGGILTDTASVDLTYNDVGNQITADVLPAGVDHDQLQNFVANEHIDHTAVDITAGDGLSGGGDISATRTIDFEPSTLSAGVIDTSADSIVFIDANDGNNPKQESVADFEGFLDHDALLNYVDAEHISFARHIYVDPTGSADETTLNAALTTAGTLSPTSSSPVYIFLSAGAHTIDNSVSTPVVPQNVYIFGTGKSTRVLGASNARNILAMRSITGFFNAQINIGASFSMFEIDANGVNPDQIIIFSDLIFASCNVIFDMVSGKINAKNCSSVSFGVSTIVETANLTANSEANIIEGFVLEDVNTIVDTQTTAFNFEITVTKCSVTRTAFNGGRLFEMDSGTLTSTYNTWGGSTPKAGNSIYELGGTATLNDDYCTQTSPYTNNFLITSANVTVVSNYGKYDSSEFSLNNESQRPNTYFDTDQGVFVNRDDSNSYVNIPLLAYTNFFE
jgi:hypothetical protein